MSIELILSIIGSVGAAISIIYTLTVDKRVKKQEEEINSSVITESKQAKFKADLEHDQKLSHSGKVINMHTLVVENIGQCTASNFSVSAVDDKGNDFFLKSGSDTFSMKLFHSRQKVDFGISIHVGSPESLILKFKWDDKIKKDRHDEYHIKLW